MREAMTWAWDAEERREEKVRELRRNRLARKSRKPRAAVLYAGAFFRELKRDFARLAEALVRRENKKGAA